MEGTELKDDPIYKDRLAKGLIEAPAERAALEGVALMRARGSVMVFLIAALLVVALGLFPGLRPSYTASVAGQESIEHIEMAPAIMIVMLAAAGT